MRVITQRFFSFGAIASLVWACSTDPARSPGGSDDETEDETTTDQRPSEPTMSHDAGASSGARDASAAPSARPDASHLVSDEASRTTPTGASTTAVDRDASVILEPDVEELVVAELCQRIGSLEGERVDVDLTAELSLSNWVTVASAGVDAAVGDASAMACAERFAAYVVPCSGSVLVITAPTFAFGEGPLVGGEQLGFGCWESACDSGCLPEPVEHAGKVRVRVTAPINPHYDEERAITVGDMRVNGVDIEGIAQLEILERR